MCLSFDAHLSLTGGNKALSGDRPSRIRRVIEIESENRVDCWTLDCGASPRPRSQAPGSGRASSGELELAPSRSLISRLHEHVWMCSIDDRAWVRADGRGALS